MPKVLLHCLNAKERPTVIQHAQSEKLHIKTPHEHNPHSIELNGETSNLEHFVKHYENNPNFAILHDHDHPKAGKDKLKPHFRRHQHEQKAEMTSHTTSYGNTCNVWKQYYNYPVQNGTAPVIAVISLGGSFKGTDLVYYWQTVLGYTSWANVLQVSVENANPTFTGNGDDTENTLDLEIAGGMCPGATIIFYSAPNTDLGFYYAISQAINGSTINGKFYQPTIISISWGAAENYYTLQP